MIAGAIKRELEDDMTVIIKIICALLRAKISGVNIFYSKIWRGREEAITHIFRSWESSYGILPQLFNVIQSINLGMKYNILIEPSIRP
jgi:hypothetical protein